jgi:hypothetical protein
MNWFYAVLLLVLPLPIRAATMTQTPAVTLVRAYLDTPASQNTLVAGSTIQFTAYGVYSDGSVAALPDGKGNAVTAWTSTSTQVGSINSGGVFTAVGPGTTNVWAKIGTLTASPWGMSVNPKPAATLVTAYLDTPASQNTLVVGSTLQFTVYGVYSDGSVATLPDAQGNAVTAWTSSAPQAASISSEGIATAVGSGKTDIWAKVGDRTASPWGLTVTDGPPIAGSTPQGSPIEDLFLGPFWKVVKPAGGWASMSNDRLLLNVPGGSNHDTLAPANQAVRVMQVIGSYNFDVSIKIDSTLVATNKGTKDGLIVTSDATHFITFEMAADGTNIHLSAETVANGSATVLLDITNFGQQQSPMYLRLSRAGSAYSAYYSTDGTNWIRATSFTYTRMPTSIGLFGSNYNVSPAMANPVAMSVDWFHAQ